MEDSQWQSSLPRVLSGSTFDGVQYKIRLSSDEAFGQGGSAEIYNGVTLGANPRFVAVKFFRDYGRIKKEVQEELLNRELRAARHISARHGSFLPFLGTASVGNRQAIVSLYMRNGNLLQYFKSNPRCNKKKLIVEVADALKHLHSVERLVHGDLKCENVLVSDSGNALLADFGLSRFLDVVQSVQATVTGIRRMYTVRFAAPELMESEEDERDRPPGKTCESDVYSFGMLVLEAVTEKLPWSVGFSDSTRAGAVEMTIMRQVLEGKQPPRPIAPTGFVSISQPWWDICKRCWSYKPGNRPRMASVFNELMNSSLEPCRQLERHKAEVYCVAYLPGRSDRVISGSTDGSIRIWDAVTGRTRLVTRILRSHSDNVFFVAVSSDGHQICSCGPDRTIRRWNAESATHIGEPMRGHDGSVNAVAFSPDGARIASCSDDQTIRLWDAATGEALGDPLRGHTNVVQAVAFSPDGGCIASGSDDGTIRLWNSSTRALLGVLQQPERSRNLEIWSICFTTDGIHLVAGCEDGTIWIWNVSTQQTTREIKAHTQSVSSVAVSPSGRYIASASFDLSIRIWDARTGKAVGAPLSGYKNWIRSVAFSPDGKSVVSASADEPIRIWDLFE